MIFHANFTANATNKYSSVKLLSLIRNYCFWAIDPCIWEYFSPLKGVSMTIDISKRSCFYIVSFLPCYSNWISPCCKIPLMRLVAFWSFMEIMPKPRLKPDMHGTIHAIVWIHYFSSKELQRNLLIILWILSMLSPKYMKR